MSCPSCGAEVEEGADLCLECGEPMGDSPAARLARAEAGGDTGAPARGGIAPAAGSGIAPPVGAAKAAPPTAAGALIGKVGAKPAAATAGNAAAAAKPTWRKWREEEPEPIRCPGCGLKTLAARCPSCGTRLRTDDE